MCRGGYRVRRVWIGLVVDSAHIEPAFSLCSAVSRGKVPCMLLRTLRDTPDSSSSGLFELRGFTVEAYIVTRPAVCVG